MTKQVGEAGQILCKLFKPELLFQNQDQDVELKCWDQEQDPTIPNWTLVSRSQDWLVAWRSGDVNSWPLKMTTTPSPGRSNMASMKSSCRGNRHMLEIAIGSCSLRYPCVFIRHAHCNIIIIIVNSSSSSSSSTCCQHCYHTQNRPRVCGTFFQFNTKCRHCENLTSNGRTQKLISL